MTESQNDRRGRTGKADDADPIQLVREALAKLRFGAVQLTIHEGKLVQMEVSEKHRFI